MQMRDEPAGRDRGGPLGSIAHCHIFKERPVSNYFGHIAGSLRLVTAVCGFYFAGEFDSLDRWAHVAGIDSGCQALNTPRVPINCHPFKGEIA
jgi:hypothetical protein